MFSLCRQRIVPGGLRTFRLAYANFSNQYDLKNLNAVRVVEKTIDDNTSIFVESPIHVKVQPVDVHDISGHNKLTMTLYSQGKQTSDFQVKQSSKRLELFNHDKSSDRSDVCVLQVPYQLNVQVTTTDTACVSLHNLEGKEFNVKTAKGSVELKDMKAKNIKVETTEGGIECQGRMQASHLELKTGLGGPISCNNIMASHFVASTHTGPINVKSCYSDRSHFTTLMGDIILDYLHRVVVIDVIQQGNLRITHFSGNLQASLKSGNVYMLASELTDKTSIFIHEKGKVEFLMPDILQNLPATNLIAEKIFVDDKIMKLGRFMDDSHPKRFRFEKGPVNELYIVCRNGSIELKETKEMPFLT